MHQDETLLCPFPTRKYEALRLAKLCNVRVNPKQEISQLARSFQERGGFGAKDAIHVACAVEIKADYFITCDDKLIKQGQRLDLAPELINPVDYIRQEKS
jgi:predicted nucleic acid-binding protein